MTNHRIVLFVYGTLHPERAPGAIAAAARRLVPIGRGGVHGRLLDFGAYPGLVLDAEEGPVEGTVYEVPDVATLAEIDAYEDFRPADHEGSLFLRTEVDVRMREGGTMRCWVYVYNRG